MFRVAPPFNLKDLEAIFQHKIFKMLLSKGKTTQDLIRMLRSWRHSGFNVFCGPRIYSRDEKATEILACYMIRASFSQERMSYLREEAKVVYESKDGKHGKVFNALEWLAAMSSHVPEKGEQMVRYYGYYSNVCRGRSKEGSNLLLAFNPYMASLPVPGGSQNIPSVQVRVETSNSE
ncbi:MAG: transposase [Candidatus Binatia bacterium]